MNKEQEVSPVTLHRFFKHLSRNHIGQPFFRFMSRASERKTIRYATEQKVTGSLGKSIEKTSLPLFLFQKRDKNMSNQKFINFKVKDGSLGNSVRLHQSKSPSKSKNIRSRQVSSRDKAQINRFNTLVLDRNAIMVQQFLKRRQDLMKSNKLDQYLSQLAKSTNIHNLRIYKQTLKKYYNLRLVKQKLTSFFDYEYIQDYDSQLLILQTLLSLNLQQIYLLCFVSLDLNGDGLLSNQDLFTLATSTQNQNPLINKDIYRIFQYVAQYQHQKSTITINDTVPDDDPLKNQAITLQKYRLIVIKAEKEKQRLSTESSSKNAKSSFRREAAPFSGKGGKGIILSRRVDRHLFSLHGEQEHGQQAIKLLRKKYAQIQLQSKINYNFKVNFDRFKVIFSNTIPEIYFEILYMQGGIKISGKNYSRINFDIDEVEKRQVNQVEVDWLSFYRGKVVGMRETYRKNRVEHYKRRNGLFK